MQTGCGAEPADGEGPLMKVKLQPGKPALPRTLLSAARQLAESGKLDQHEAALVDAVATGARGSATRPDDLFDVLERHRSELSSNQRRALGRALGRAPATVIDFDSAVERLRPSFGDDVKRLVARAQDGPDVSLTERRVLEDLLVRHGYVLEPQLRNLVVGFLRTMPDETSAPEHSGQFGALSKVVALRGDQTAGQAAATGAALTPRPRAQIEQLLDAHGGRGHLLVALGAATPAELRRLDAGQMNLVDFFGVAARGHFNGSVDQPIALADLSERLNGAGLETDLDRLLHAASSDEHERLVGGEASPRQIFALLASTYAAVR